MLIRDAFSKYSIIMLSVMGLSLIYSKYITYKYSNCKIESFLVTDFDKNIIKIEYTQNNKKREVDLVIKDAIFPSKNSKDQCEQNTHIKIDSEIDQLIKNTRNKYLLLKNCKNGIKQTTGDIIINDEKQILKFIEDKKIPKKRFFKFKAIDWCEYLKR